MTLNADHSFIAISTFKEALSTPSVFEDRGTWRVEGTEVKINAALVHTPNNWRTSTAVLDIARGVLVVNRTDATGARNYQRFEPPACTDGSAIVSGQSLRETQLTGSWKMHFHTHDYQVQLLEDGKLVVLGFSEDKWDPLSLGDWRIDGTRLVMRSRNALLDSAREEESAWSIIAVGKNCFLAQDIDAGQFTLQRLSESELTARPSGALVSTASSPPPAETPSPEH